jgi:hypothetical protein
LARRRLALTTSDDAATYSGSPVARPGGRITGNDRLRRMAPPPVGRYVRNVPTASFLLLLWRI